MDISSLVTPLPQFQVDRNVCQSDAMLKSLPTSMFTLDDPSAFVSASRGLLALTPAPMGLLTSAPAQMGLSGACAPAPLGLSTFVPAQMGLSASVFAYSGHPMLIFGNVCEPFLRLWTVLFFQFQKLIQFSQWLLDVHWPAHIHNLHLYLSLTCLMRSKTVYEICQLIKIRSLQGFLRSHDYLALLQNLNIP
jgi:hypothetical protein